MVKRNVEIEDNLDEIIESVKDDVKTLIIDYIKENSQIVRVREITKKSYFGG